VESKLQPHSLELIEEDESNDNKDESKVFSSEEVTENIDFNVFDCLRMLKQRES